MADDAGKIPEFDPRRVAEKLARTGRPWVTLKAATTLDGKIATARGESQWITGEAARGLGHRLRALHGAVLVGINTVLADDPRLTVRHSTVGDLGDPAVAALADSPLTASEQPARIVLDSRLRTPDAAALLEDNGARRFVIAGSDASDERSASLQRSGAVVYRCRTSRPQPEEFLPWLRTQGVERILVEGGSRVHGDFIAKGEADELFLFVSGKVIGEQAAPGWCEGLTVQALSAATRLKLSPPRAVGEDLLLHGLFAQT